MDAHSFNDMGMSNFLVQNNFGTSVGGPVWHIGKTFFFVNYEGLRNVETMAMVDTVPTAAEDGRRFSQSGVNIYDPTTTQPIRISIRAFPSVNRTRSLSASSLNTTAC